MNKWRNGPVLTGLLLVASACAGEQNNDDLVARVGTHRFTVDQAIRLLVDEERLATDVSVVNSLAELWVDYTLLAEAAARDTMFSELDLEPLIMQQLSQVMVSQLRDSIIQVDTFITEDELRRRYESEAPALEIHARHIMLQLPVQATPNQRDSVAAALQDIRRRIASGESFEALARMFSQDPGSAAGGGDLGFFARGDMVRPFEEVALELELGEVSDVVETPFGLHLIRVDERRLKSFDETASAYRFQVQSRMVAEAESLFVTGLVERADPQLAEGAVDVVREMAENPGIRLSRRAARRRVLEWDGGAITMGALQEVLRLESAPFRSQLVESSDEEIEDFIRERGRRDLLVRQAQESGLQPGRDSIDALVADAAGQLRGAARMLGLLDLDQAPGEPREVAVARAVEEALRNNLTGATQVVPLGLLGFQLRERTPSMVLEVGVGRVIVTVAQMRAARSLSPLEQMLDSARALPDTVAP